MESESNCFQSKKLVIHKNTSHMKTKNFDVFNGDADGICALLQLHLTNPQMLNNQLITGIKRDIKLLKKISIDEPVSHITVLDISLDQNRQELEQLLNRGFSVFYADHHYAGDFPEHPGLQRHIDIQSNTCTSMIINSVLNQAFFQWAITGAFGDNMNHSAEQLCALHQVSENNGKKLKKLGTYINYNAYGSCLDDLHYLPDQLFTQLRNYQTPLEFINDSHSDFSFLEEAYYSDMSSARQTKPFVETAQIAVFILDDSTWSKRVNGVWGNELANQFPERAHAVLTHNIDDSYSVSVRAPLLKRIGADELCRQFPSGGGRKAAAGINNLPINQLDKFIKAFELQYK
jgi:hypothetical protein